MALAACGPAPQQPAAVPLAAAGSPAMPHMTPNVLFSGYDVVDLSVTVA